MLDIALIVWHGKWNYNKIKITSNRRKDKVLPMLLHKIRMKIS